MTFRPPLYVRQWELDPLGISRRSQDGVRNNLLETTLRSQDARLVGRQSFDLSPGQVPFRPNVSFDRADPSLGVLIGKDQFLQQSRQFSDPNPLPARQPDRFQSQGLVLTTLAGQDAALVGKQLFERPDPKGPYQFVRDWAQNLVVSTLAGQDAKLAGHQWFDRPLPPSQPVIWAPPNLLGTTLGQIALPPGTQWFALPGPPAQPDRFYQQSLVLGTLAGQDAKLTGGQIFELPKAPFQPDRSFYRQNLNLSLLAGQDQFLPQPRQWSAPNPPPLKQPDRFQAQSLVLTTLLSQDAILVGRQLFALPQAAVQPSRFYALSLQPWLIPPLFPVGAQWFALPLVRQYPAPWQPAINAYLAYEYLDQFFGAPGQVLNYDWPLPRVADSGFRSYSQSSQVHLYSFATPFFQTDWPLPRAAVQPIRTWVNWYNLNLIGKDSLPVRQQDWPLPRGVIQPIRAWTWNQQIQPPLVPFFQTDWPLPRAVIQPIRGWVSWYNLNLIGRDALPFRQGDWPLPTAPPQLVRAWTTNSPIHFPSLIIRPFAQYDWPLPQGPYYPVTGTLYVRGSYGPQPPALAPFTQYEWPLPKLAAQPGRGFAYQPFLLFPPIIPPTPPLPPPVIVLPNGRWRSVVASGESFLTDFNYLSPIVGEIGFALFFDTGLASSALLPAMTLTFVKPSGEILSVSHASFFGGADPVAGNLSVQRNFVRYIFGPGDLDEAGRWAVFLTIGTSRASGIAYFRVLSQIEALLN